jgi:hypothetical protein
MEFEPNLFLEPWVAVAPDRATAFEAEIQRELSAEHPLHGVTLSALACSHRADDVLFRMDDGRVVDVHLTWSRRTESPPWPSHDIYPNLDAWRQHVMLPDHADS